MDATAVFGDPRVPERIWRKIEVQPDGCWMWGGYIDRDGYGSAWHNHHMRLAHRVMYSLLVGDPGPELDHNCHDPKACQGECPHRRCVNPTHCKPTTRSENCKVERMSHNFARRTHCKRGHEYTDANIHWYKGYRLCKTCRSINSKKYSSRRT